MSSPDPSTNGGVPPKPEFELHLEPVNPDELNLDGISTVEAAAPDNVLAAEVRMAAGFWDAVPWILLFGFVIAVSIVSVHFDAAALGITVSVLIALGFIVYSATRRGFRFGKAFAWCLLFILATQGVPGILMGVAIGVAMAFGAQFNLKDPAFMTSPEARPIVIGTMMIGQMVTIFFSLLVLRYIVGKNWKRQIYLRMPSFQHLALIVIAIPALLVLSNAVEFVVVRFVPNMKQLGLNIDVEDIVKSTAAWPWGLGVMIIGFGPAIGEELWCRGFLGARLGSYYGLAGSVLLTSFLFGLIHVEPPQAVMAMLMGIVLHLSYLATRSILAPMLIHLANNSLIILSLNGAFPLLKTLESAYEHAPVLSVVVSIGLVGVVSYALCRTRARIVDVKENETFQYLFAPSESPGNPGPSRFVTGSLTALEVGILLVAAALFAAIWFGL